MPVTCSPLGFYDVHTQADLTYYATCIYNDLLKCNGDPKTWWNNEWFWYRECIHEGMRFVSRDGAMHFWRRLPTIVPQPMEVEVIDLTRDDDVEIIDLTQDETDDEENDNEDEDSEMGYETQEDTEQGPEIIDLTKDYV